MNAVEIKPSFDLTDFYLDFFTKGIVAFDGTAILHDIRLKSLEALTEKFPGGDLAADAVHLEYVRNPDDEAVIAELMGRINNLGIPIDTNSLKFHFLEYRTNTDVLKWHNDNGSFFADHNITINCFLDDTCEETGGRFDVCGYLPEIARKTEDHPQMHSIYPKKYTIVVFNQNPDFLHKVQMTNKLRRMIGYAAKTL